MSENQIKEQKGIALALLALADQGIRAWQVNLTYDLATGHGIRVEVKSRPSSTFTFTRPLKGDRRWDVVIGVVLGANPTYYIGTWDELKRQIPEGGRWQPSKAPNRYRDRWDKLR